MSRSQVLHIWGSALCVAQEDVAGHVERDASSSSTV